MNMFNCVYGYINRALTLTVFNICLFVCLSLVVVEEGDIPEVAVGVMAVVTEIVVTAAEMEATNHHEAMEGVGTVVTAAETATVAVVAVEGTATAEEAEIVIVAETAMEEVEEIVMEEETATPAGAEEAAVMAEGTAAAEEGGRDSYGGGGRDSYGSSSYGKGGSYRDRSRSPPPRSSNRLAKYLGIILVSCLI